MHLSLPLRYKNTDGEQIVETQILLDSGAKELSMNQTFVEKNQIPTIPLLKLIIPQKIDGTTNQSGRITHCTWAHIIFDDQQLLTRFLITNTRKSDVLLGLAWLKEHNPTINWKTGRIFILRQTMNQKLTAATRRMVEIQNKWSLQRQMQWTKIQEEPDPEELLNWTQYLIMEEEIPKLNICEFTLEDKRTQEHLEPLKDTWITQAMNFSTKLAQKENAKKEDTQTLPEIVPPELHEYLDVFDKEKAKQFLESQPWDHAIKLKEGFLPLDCKLYPLTLPETKEMNKFINKNLAKGYIRPSKSLMASSFFFVDKKDSVENTRLWPCQDYRKLNAGTIKNMYPLPLISGLLDKLKGAKYFTKSDLQARYNNVWIKDDDQWKAAFKTSRELFEPMVMFFGMCNSPATFHKMMDKIFANQIREGNLIIYMHDMFIHSSDLLINIACIRKALEWLWENDLYAKPEKCVFWGEKVDCLGMIIKEGKIGMDPVKLKGIKDWPESTTVKELQQFLGFANYYWQFIQGYRNLTAPLNTLLKKTKKYKWTPERQKAFDTLKEQFMEAPVLYMPDQMKPFILKTDALKHASGAVLRQ